MPTGTDYCVFDTAINSGPGRAAKFLQEVVGVTADGAIGPRPLAAAEVKVEEVPGAPGYYTSKFFLRPHYQLEGLTVSLRLVSKLPSAKGGK